MKVSRRLILLNANRPNVEQNINGITSKHVLEASHVHFSYENKYTVFNDINLEINENEFVGIVGPSGIGKSTLLRILGGFLKPTNGEIYLMGNKIQCFILRYYRHVIDSIIIVPYEDLPFNGYSLAIFKSAREIQSAGNL